MTWETLVLFRFLDSHSLIICRLFEGEHGGLFIKMFAVLADRVISKKTAKHMTEVIEAFEEKKKLDQLNEEAKTLVRDHQHCKSSLCPFSPGYGFSSESPSDPREVLGYLTLLEQIVEGMLKEINRLESVSGGNAQELKDAIQKLTENGVDTDCVKDWKNHYAFTWSTSTLASEINDRLDMIADMMEELKIRADNQSDPSSSKIDSFAANDLLIHKCGPLYGEKTLEPSSKDSKKTAISKANATIVHLQNTYEEHRKIPLVRSTSKLKEAIERASELVERGSEPSTFQH